MNPIVPTRNFILLILGVYCALMASSTVLAVESSVIPSAKATPQDEVLNNAGVVELKQLGLGDGIIVEKIKSSKCDFDTSIAGLKQLKAANVPDAVIAAMLSAKSPSSATSNESSLPAGDSNDPKSPHDAGIWLCEQRDGKRTMKALEPSVYSQSKMGVAFFAQFGQQVKSEAVLRSAHAETEVTNRRPVFYFYFEKTQSGLSDTGHSATSPNEFILSQFEVSEKDNQRRLVMGQAGLYSGSESGAEGKSVRSFSYEKLGPGMYKVVPKEDLASGDYGFFYAGNSAAGAHSGGKVYDFRVNGPAETEPKVVIADTKTEQKPKDNVFKRVFHKTKADNE
jgi:hypothetical protein